MVKQGISVFSPEGLFADLRASVVVFLVALPLCLGIALASGAPLMSGLIAGILGGIVVGALSGSHTSVSGPAAGLTAIVTAQIATLESFEAFLLAVVIGGILQIVLGILKAGALSAFFPSSVIRGLLAAIGVILILKQIPHLVGHDSDPVGDDAFKQKDGHNPFSELWTVFEGDLHYGAALVGVVCFALLLIWGRSKWLQKTQIPAPLAVVVLGVVMKLIMDGYSEMWAIGSSHLVTLPKGDTVREFLTFPDFSRELLFSSKLYIAGITVAIVASLETLLNLEAVDKLDPEKRDSPGSRELIAQGVGNICSGMIGGLPMTSVIIRSSVNVNQGAKTKRSAIFHGFLLILCVAMIPTYLEMIPLAALAAILLNTGFKLASPALFKQMIKEGPYQAIPFFVTLFSIVLTDLLIGILIGLAVSVLFILNSNLRRPIRRIVETHLDGEILHVELANQVSFLNRASLDLLFTEAKPGTHMLIDASGSDYIDPDVLSMIREFKEVKGPANDVQVSLRGFREKYQLHDEIQFADFSSRELQDRATPKQVLNILREGNKRFQTGTRLTRDYSRQVCATAGGQNPLAAVLSCIDSRVPTELVFDLGIGDIFSVRVAGNIAGTKSLGSMEYAVAVAGVKLVLVLGHTRCGAVTASVDFLGSDTSVEEATGCKHIPAIVDEIQKVMEPSDADRYKQTSDEEKPHFVDEVAKQNVLRTVKEVVRQSEAIRRAVESGQVIVVGALYDVGTGAIEFYEDATVSQESPVA